MNDQERAADSPSQEQMNEHLGLAGWMAKVFITSPLSPILLILSFSVGLLGLVITPRQEDPQISVPIVDIFVGYSGASSAQTATQVADPLERIMSEIQGVDHVYSASRRGMSMVTVQFDVGQSMGPSLVKLYDKLQSNMDKIPRGATPPLVKPKAIDDVPAVAITLSSKVVDDSMLRLLGNDLLQRIKEVPDTGPGFIAGGREEQIRVEVDISKLTAFGISLGQIAQTIASSNSEQQVGQYELGQGNFNVYTGSFLRHATDVSRLVVGVLHDAPVFLADVANVIAGPAETTRLVRHYTGQAYNGSQPANGDAAITVAVAKKKGTNGVTVAKAILQRVEELKGYLIPDNVEVTVTRNYGETADQKVNDLLFKLMIATMAVTLLVWLFLGFRPAVVVLIVIPIVILVTVFGAWLLDFTIDRVSLFALIFAIGILVDDAIVVVENIYRRWLMQRDTSIEIEVDAVREVGNPTIVATFTVIAALLPMGFVGDMMGPYMMPIPALGSLAMLFSLFAAFAFTPWLVYKLRPSMKTLEQAEAAEKRFQLAIGRAYSGLMYKLLSSRRLSWITLVTILVVWCASVSLFYTQAVTVKMMPYDNKPEFNVVVNMPAGTALPITASVTAELAQKVLQEVAEVVDLQSYSGSVSPYNFNGMVRHYYLRQQPWQADIQIKLLNKNDRLRSSHEIAEHTRQLLTPIAKKLNARITVAEMPPGPPVLQTMVAEVYGPDANTRRQVARDLTEIFEQAENIGDVDNYMEETHQITHFEVDKIKAMQLGISVDTINQNLAMAMGGFVAGDIKQSHSLEPVKIILQLPHSERALIARVAGLPIPTADGRLVPLFELGEFKQIEDDPIVYHKDLRAVEYVVGESVGELAAPIYGIFEVEDRLENYIAPDGVALTGNMLAAPDTDMKSGFKWDGEWRVTYITFRDMGLAFAAAMFMIYILVVWEFGNFKVPLIIISPIPLTMIGIMFGHWLMDAEFTATSMIGFIALAGIIVRNSILLVDFAQQAIRDGTEAREALALAGQARLRPIVITALALMAGSSVILFDPIFQGMAVSLLFGVMVATLLTLIVIPMGCDTWRAAVCRNLNVDKDQDASNKEQAKQGADIENTKTVTATSQPLVKHGQQQVARNIEPTVAESQQTAPTSKHTPRQLAGRTRTKRSSTVIVDDINENKSAPNDASSKSATQSSQVSTKKNGVVRKVSKKRGKRRGIRLKTQY